LFGRRSEDNARTSRPDARARSSGSLKGLTPSSHSRQSRTGRWRAKKGPHAERDRRSGPWDSRQATAPPGVRRFGEETDGAGGGETISRRVDFFFPIYVRSSKGTRQNPKISAGFAGGWSCESPPDFRLPGVCGKGNYFCPSNAWPISPVAHRGEGGVHGPSSCRFKSDYACRNGAHARRTSRRMRFWQDTSARSRLVFFHHRNEGIRRISADRSAPPLVLVPVRNVRFLPRGAAGSIGIISGGDHGAAAGLLAGAHPAARAGPDLA